MSAKKILKATLLSIGFYLCWEVSALMLSLLVNQLWPEIANPVINQYLLMTLTELLVFIVWWFIFRKHLSIAPTKESLRLPVIILIPVALQIFQDFYLLVANHSYYSTFSKDGLIILLFCLMGAFSIALCEEFFWRRLIFGKMIQILGATKRGVISSIMLSSLMFGLCHYMNILTGGQTFADTTQQVIAAMCSGFFFAAVYYRSGSLMVPIAIHGFCNYTNFIMNEFLNYTYTPPTLFSAFDYIIPLLYVLCGVIVLLQSINFQQLS